MQTLHGRLLALASGSIIFLTSVAIAVLFLPLVLAQAPPSQGSASQPLSPPIPMPGTGSYTFPETGKTVSGAFLAYWQRNGGLSQQGYPISNLIGEVSPLNGMTYTMQYFERAVFEYHPDEKPPYNVLLSQLGTFQYKKKYPTGAWTEAEQRPRLHFLRADGAQSRRLVPAILATTWRTGTARLPPLRRIHRGIGPERQALHGAVFRARRVRVAP